MKALELFAGAGGAALGLHRAGFDHALLVERDPAAAATLEAAQLGPVVCADVREVDYSRHLGIDLLWASPPCQAWSSAGKRLGASDTERNGWPWTWEIVDQVAPQWLVCENVPGLLQHSAAYHPDLMRCAGCYWERVILPAARARFRWVDVWKLNAADYGVPQTRRRVFLVCGDRRVSRPAPTHGDPATLSPLFDQRQPWRTVRQALGIEVYKVATAHEGGVTAADLDLQPLTDRPAVAVSSLSSISAGGSMVAICYGRGRENGLVYEEHSLDEPACALRGSDGGSTMPFLCTAGTTGQSIHPITRPAATIGGGGNAYLLDRPSPTVVGVDGVGLGSAQSRDLSEKLIGRRRLTTGEAATLQAFPDDHPWRGSITAVYRQIGNAVPPPVAEAIGRALIG